ARGVSDHTTFSWSPDGTQLAFTRGGGSSNKEVWLVNADGSGLKRLTFSAGKGNRSSFYNYSENPSWSPDGETIAFDGERKSSVLVRPQVFTIRTDGTGEHQVTHAATPAFLPAWSPAGKILFEQWVGKYSGSAFLHSGQIDLFLVDANGRNRARVARVRNELN